MSFTLFLKDEQATQQLANTFASYLNLSATLTFSGEIGAGKTTFIRALLTALGVDGAIKSPTFSLVESYSLKNLTIHHFDLYRIVDESELEYIGFRDYFENALCCIEWPERLTSQWMAKDLIFSFHMKDEGRMVTIDAGTNLGKKILAKLVV